MLQVCAEAAASVDRAGHDGRKEPEQVKVLERPDFVDDVVVNLNHNLNYLEGHVGNAQESEHVIGVSDSGQHFIRRYRQNTQRKE